MSSIEEELYRLNYELDEEPIPFIPYATMNELRFDGLQFRLVKDQPVMIPNWVAQVLAEEKMGDIQTDVTITPKNLREIAHQEGENKKPSKLDSLLYRKIRVEIERLSKEGTPHALRRQVSLQGSLHTIIRRRFNKILTFASAGDPHEITDDSLSLEEKWLYIRLHEIFTGWRDLVGKDIEWSE